MYDEVTRQQDHLWASLAYAQEEGIRQGIEQGHAAGRAEGMKLGIERGIEQGIERGIERGIEQGIEQGKENTIISLFKKGYINKELAAEELKIDVKELDEYLY